MIGTLSLAKDTPFFVRVTLKAAGLLRFCKDSLIPMVGVEFVVRKIIFWCSRELLRGKGLKIEWVGNKRERDEMVEDMRKEFNWFSFVSVEIIK